MKSEAIPAPSTEKHGAAFVARWNEEQAILNADARTGGAAPRAAWLVQRVLREHGVRA
jgi:hypothetical protein